MNPGIPQVSVHGPTLFSICVIPLSAIIKSHSITHHSFGNDLQLQAPAPPDEISEILYSMQSSKSNVSYWAIAIMLMRYDYNT